MLSPTFHGQVYVARDSSSTEVCYRVVAGVIQDAEVTRTGPDLPPPIDQGDHVSRLNVLLKHGFTCSTTSGWN